MKFEIKLYSIEKKGGEVEATEEILGKRVQSVFLEKSE